MNNEELLQTVLKDMTILKVENVRVFAHMVPTASLRRFWTMKAQTMELRDEFTSGPRFLQVCEGLRSGEVSFDRFQYTGYLRIAGDQFDVFWDQMQERVGFGIDDEVRVNRNSIHFITSDGNLIIKLSIKKLLFPSNCYQLSVNMEREVDITVVFIRRAVGQAHKISSSSAPIVFCTRTIFLLFFRTPGNSNYQQL
ncbi:Protein CBG06674 [Caenorhabditis briggsae]|uniref:Protein CBG06674 n=1 Tax=Caenorhabditis briggsae TaxID=6238 RepID=A8X2U0_CAEBR|nr:Protein CBG06674 [Caenorhabditis briggsae]CAP26950.2 Protein CBG06674 [Caenorhabditis briggsae]